MKDFCVSFPCCHPESCIPGLRGGVRLEEPAAGNLHGGVCEGGESWEATVNLNGHETGNGGNSQGEPTASRDLLYSEVHRSDGFPMIAQKGHPSLCRIGIPWRFPHPAQHVPFRNVEAKHLQFAMNPWRAPGWVLPNHAEDEFAEFNADALPAGMNWSRESQVQYSLKPARCHRTTVSG